MSSSRHHPRRVVAIGGGTGLPAVLRGLRRHVGPDGIRDLVGIVVMTDDGGSSGRLRRTRGLPPPGDVRKCLVALSREEDLLAGIFQHRYGGSEEIGGHTLGNLFLAALAEQTGSFLKAVEMSSRVLRTAGRILPASLDDVRLEASLEDGSTIHGESAIAKCERHIVRIRVAPESASPTPGVLEALRRADMIVLGPGSLFTSVIPNLTVAGVSRAVRQSRAIRVMVGNLVSERGEASGLGLADHVRLVEEHAGGPCVDAVLVHRGQIPAQVRERYRKEGAKPLDWRSDDSSIAVFRQDLLDRGAPKLRHDADATALGLFEVWEAWSRKRGAAGRRLRARS